MKNGNGISHRTIGGTALLASPSGTAPRRVTPADRALAVMTDLRQRSPVTVRHDLAIDAALAEMIRAGVRLVFVLDQAQRLVGLVSSYDIQGEKPLRFLQSLGCTHKTCRHDDVRVGDIMEPLGAWQVLALADVAHATVGDIVATLESSGRTHLVVVEPGQGPAQVTVRGLFSATQVSRQLGTRVETLQTAVTFAEIEAALSHSAVLA